MFKQFGFVGCHANNITIPFATDIRIDPFDACVVKLPIPSEMKHFKTSTRSSVERSENKNEE